MRMTAAHEASVVPNAERILLLGLRTSRAAWTVEEDLRAHENRPVVPREHPTDRRREHPIDEAAARRFGWRSEDGRRARRATLSRQCRRSRLLRPAIGDRSRATTETDVRAPARRPGIIPTYRLVDTCAAEFEAYTPTTTPPTATRTSAATRAKRRSSFSAADRTASGRGSSSTTAAVHAAFALRELGFETSWSTRTPRPFRTDYDTSDKLYFEPLTLEDVLNICEQETRTSSA